MTSGARRVVVKLGSSVVTDAGPSRIEVDRNTVFRLATDMAGVAREGVSVIVVSSGAVALGVEELGLAARPSDLSGMQAMAAVGQGLLMQLWREAFGRHGVRVGQILLTHSDLADRQRFLNVRATLEALLHYGVVPIINENDSVMTDEITVGDNDRLAAQVAKLIGADRLLLLSTVQGLLDDDGHLVPQVLAGDDAEKLVLEGQSDSGRGGMASKLRSARAAAHGGIDVVIASGRAPHVVRDVVGGASVGTRVVPTARGLQSRKHWIAYTLKPAGTLHLDAGAVRALTGEGASLLPVGVQGVEGRFASGDAVSLLGPDGVEVGRGLVRIGSDELAGRLGQGAVGTSPLVHRDDLVIFSPEDGPR